MNNEEKEIFSGDYLGLFENGEIGISDGCGFVGTMEKDEVKELYIALKGIFNE